LASQSNVFHASNNVKAYKISGCHIFALELDMEVSKEMVEPMVVVAMPKAKPPHLQNFDLDFLIKNIPRGSLLMSNFSLCFMILYFFHFFVFVSS
jgi:hypothetical protein